MKMYTDDELLVEFVKHYELEDVELYSTICADISCHYCKVLEICNSNNLRSAVPMLTKNGINMLKKDYPELLV